MSKTLQTVEEIATEKYPVHHIEDIGDINTEARIAFISGYKAANQAAQGYRDALEKIIHIIKDETLDISQTIDFAEETAQQTLSAAPTTQETNGWAENNQDRCNKGLHFPIKNGTCILCGKPLPLNPQP